MKVHYLQHVSFEGLGFIEAWLKQNGHIVTGLHLYEGKCKFPPIEDIEALIILGGPMSIYDEHLYNWIHDEKIFIKSCILAGKKVLGICLGAQLIADCLGANILPAKNVEIGWFPIFPTAELKNIGWLYEIFKDKITVFHWHGEKFEIPSGCSNLLISAANNNQAFCYNQKVMGLQFHLEVTEHSLRLMIDNSRADLNNEPFIQSIPEIEEGRKYLQICNEMMACILYQWIFG